MDFWEYIRLTTIYHKMDPYLHVKQSRREKEAAAKKSAKAREEREKRAETRGRRPVLVSNADAEAAAAARAEAAAEAAAVMGPPVLVSHAAAEAATSSYARSRARAAVAASAGAERDPFTVGQKVNYLNDRGDAQLMTIVKVSRHPDGTSYQLEYKDKRSGMKRYKETTKRHLSIPGFHEPMRF